MSHELAERVSDLEQQMSQQVQASSELTQAVNELTNVLTSGKMAIKILCYIASGVAAVAMALVWVSNNIRFN